jgi:hypothetical protein
VVCSLPFLGPGVRGRDRVRRPRQLRQLTTATATGAAGLIIALNAFLLAQTFA